MKDLTPVPEVSDNPVDIVETILTNQGRGKWIKRPSKATIQKLKIFFQSWPKKIHEGSFTT